MKEQDLPGFDLVTIDKQATDYQDLSEDKTFTAEKLLVSHPDRYAIAARMYFEMGCSKRSVCEICKIGPHTLKALIERECLSRGGEVLAKRGKVKKSMIKMELIESLMEEIESGALGNFGFENKLELIERFERLVKDPEDGQKANPASSNASTDEPIDADYEVVANRLKS